MSRLPGTPRIAEITGLTHGGEGVTRVAGKAVFVAGTIPGERVLLRVVDDRRRWARAELVEVVDPSPDRVAAPCARIDDCGGCDLAHVAPAAARRLKARVVREQLERLGGLDDPPVAPTRPVGPDRRYRNDARLHAGPDGRLGFHRSGSHDVVPVEHCPVLAPEVEALRQAVGDSTGAVAARLRAHGSSGTAAVALWPGAGPLALPDGAFDLLLAQPGGELVPLRGDGHLAETVALPATASGPGEVTLRFDATSFFQPSRGGAEAIVDTVLAAAGDVDGAFVWDLYAGVGLLSLPLAGHGAEVVAVEGHPPSTRWVARNAGEHGLAVATVTADVRHFVADPPGVADRGDGGVARAGLEDPPDVVVLDPPRSGAGGGVCQRLAALRPAAIVYVACDPAALARDARTLAAAGYRLAAATPLDLFPLTHHVETVATFRP